MSTTYTANLNLGKPGAGDTGWGVTANATFDAIEALAPIAAFHVAPAETPSTTLNVRIAPGAFIAPDGSIAFFAGASSQPIPPSATRLLYLDGNGDVGVSTVYPSAPHLRLAVVSTDASHVTNIADERIGATPMLTFLPLAGGTLADAANLALGTADGTKIGTASNQKIGFLGATPIVQRTMGPATAGVSYTATEQVMLQRVYDALRAFGFGS